MKNTHSLFMLSAFFLISQSYADALNGSPVTIKSKATGSCIDIRSPITTSGQAIVQMSCSEAASQKWKLIPLSSNHFQIVSNANNMCFDLNASSKVNGGILKQSACISNKRNQTWYIREASPGAYQIISLNSDKCLEIKNSLPDNNLQLQQYDCAASKANQLWTLANERKISAPIVINGQTNVTISDVKISNPKGPCILVKGNSKNITIKNSELGPCKTDPASKSDLSNLGAGIFVTASNDVNVDNVDIHDTEDAGVTIFYGTNYSVTNSNIKNAKDAGIKAQSLSNITIRNNTIDTVKRGVHIAKGTGVVVEKNKISHIQDAGGRSSMILFNKVTGSGNKIACNIGIQDPYGTPNSLDATGDNFSIYSSYGTASSPLLIVGNKMKNGGPNKSGSGIMTGDNGGGYIIVRDNVLVNTGNLGIGVASGTNITVINNKIFSVNLPITNNALAAWNYYKTTQPCNNITVSGNQVNWTNKWGPESKVWQNNTCSNSNLNNNSYKDSSITEEIFDTYNSRECAE